MASASLSAAQTSKIRRLALPREAAPGDVAGELNIVPYLDILMNVMLFVLATIAVSFVTTIDTQPARANPILHGAAPKGLGLTVLLTSEGYAVKTSAGAIAPGCATLGTGVTVPKRAGAYDPPALAACAKKLKESAPELADERQVTLSANAAVPYADLIDAMDALRRDGDRPLFPDAVLGVVR